MKRWGILLIFLLVLSTVPGTAFQGVSAATTTIQISPTDDAYVKDSAPDSNYGSAGSLYVGTYYKDGSNERAYLKFNLSKYLPENAVIISATLHAYTHSGAYSTPVNISVYAVSNDSWTEDSITWNNKPPAGELLDKDLVDTEGRHWSIWNVTDFVRQEFNGDKVVSFVLISDVEGSVKESISYNSKESSHGNYPYLEIVYTLPKNVQISSVEVPQLVWKGEETEILVTVNNSDAANYSSFNLTVAVDDNIIYENTSFSIGASEEKTISIPWTPEELGTHEIAVTLKDENGALLSSKTVQTEVGVKVPIQEIQSNTSDGDASVYTGYIVTTAGVVTGIAHWTSHGEDRYGFFIQNGTGPWSGIFVSTYNESPKYDNGTPIALGDKVKVIGKVIESYGLTTIGYVSSITRADDVPLDVPEPVVLQTGEVAQEQWESVLVKVENVVVTNPDLGYGEWEVDDGSGPVRVDDLMYSYAPQKGQKLSYVIGVVYYSYGTFKIEPRNENDIGLQPEILNVSIQEIQSNTSDGDASVYEGQEVATEGVVTAVTSQGFFIQNGTGPWSGIYVYLGSAPEVNQGDYVRVVGTVDEYYGMTELKVAPENVTILGTADVPEPVVLQTGEVAQEQWESVLVKVENVVVTNPDLGYGEWEVDDGSGPVRVDDLMYSYAPQKGQKLSYVIGVVYYSYGTFKIEPRNENDIGLVISQYQPIREIRENWESDKQVVTSGIVIGTRSTGFFIQDGTEPYSGIYVYVGKSFENDVKPGDIVQVNGTTAVYKGLYEITDPTYKVIGSAELPEPVLIKAAEMSDAYQSMRVRLEWVKITEVDGRSITVADDTGTLILYDYYGIMDDMVPGKILRYVEGIGYKYNIIEVYPTDYELYIPSIHISDVVRPDRLIRNVPVQFQVTITNNGTVGDNVTLVVYANGVEIKNVTKWIESGSSVNESFEYTPRDLGELRIDIQLLTKEWGVTEEVVYDYNVVPSPNTLAYGLSIYYGHRYKTELSDLDELYEEFTSVVSNLTSYGVTFDDRLKEKIDWIQSSMATVTEEYSRYNQLTARAEKTGFYFPAMMHIRKALFLGEKVKEEIQFLLPYLEGALENVKSSSNQTGAPTNITLTITRVLIDASHDQHYVEDVGVETLSEKIRSELGWEVDINELRLTYNLLKEYDVVILLNPREELTPDEVAALQKYVENGGGLFIAGDWYKYSKLESLNAVVSKYGIKFNADELMDDEKNSGKPYYPFVGIYNRAHPAMKFVPEDWTMYYNGQTLTISGNAVWLIKGYDTSYSVDADGNVVMAKGTNPILAAAVEAGKGRIIVYGSSKALSDDYYQKYIKSNWPFVKGALLWLAHQE